NVLKVAKNDESDTFKTKATFVELAPNPGNIQAGGTVVATPHNYLVNINLLQQQGMFIKCNIDGTVQLSQLTSDDDKKNGTFNIIAGLDANIKNAVSFQVYSYGQYYLKNQNGALKVDKLKNTATFNTNATFVTVQGLAGNGYSYEAANQPGHYIVADNGVLKISKDDGSAAFNKAATFMEMPLEPKPQAPVKK
ncbi:MAG TPA: AbfB domain-containing protein, partial [Chitinophagaceae bacterium]|nr:AbfB domain-containing protein [Chitinophagaceae bacterium]